MCVCLHRLGQGGGCLTGCVPATCDRAVWKQQGDDCFLYISYICNDTFSIFQVICCLLSSATLASSADGVAPCSCGLVVCGCCGRPRRLETSSAVVRFYVSDVFTTTLLIVQFVAVCSMVSAVLLLDLVLLRVAAVCLCVADAGGRHNRKNSVVVVFVFPPCVH